MGLGEFDGEGDDDDEDKEDEEVEGVKTSKKDDVMNKAEGDKGMYSGKIITKSKK